MDFNGTLGRDATVRVFAVMYQLGGELWGYGAMVLWGYGDCVSVLSCPSGQNRLK